MNTMRQWNPLAAFVFWASSCPYLCRWYTCLNEAEWNLMAPDGVSIHATRMPLHDDTSSEAGKQALYRDVETATRDLAQAGLDVVAYGCTAGSMLLPLTGLSDYMAGIAAAPCVTTAASIVAALNHLGAAKIVIATPYHEALNTREKRFFESAGFGVLDIRGLGIGENGDYLGIARTPPEDILAHVAATDRQDAEAVVVSCTDFPALGIIGELEKTLGKPVVTSNQATFWAALRAARIEDRFSQFGSLLRDG